MPEDAVRAAVDRDDVAAGFGVSSEAMGWRLYTLRSRSRATSVTPDTALRMSSELPIVS